MNLDNDRIFANIIRSQFRLVFQYQQKSVLEWVAHLEHLQLILLEYNPIEAPIESTMLRYFWNGLWFFILAKLQNKDLKLESFMQMVKKAIIAKAKANLWPWVTAQNMDQQCPWGFRPINTTAAKASSQGNS